MRFRGAGGVQERFRGACGVQGRAGRGQVPAAEPLPPQDAGADLLPEAGAGAVCIGGTLAEEKVKEKLEGGDKEGDDKEKIEKTSW